MHIIQIKAIDEEQGAYNDHKSDNITAPPDGWAMIPEGFPLPSTFPRLGCPPKAEPITYPYEVDVEVKNEETGEVEIVKEQRERVIMTVTEMTEGTLPEPVEPEPTNDELVWQAITDLEIAQMEYDQALTDLEIAQLEGSAE